MPGPALPHLETFQLAAECGSFTAAAHALGLTQAAVSQRIQTLEKELDVSLFRRESSRITLTDAGRRLHEFAQRIQALHAEARQAVTGLRTTAPTELTLAASSVPGEHLLPGLLAHFRDRFPHVQIRAVVADSLEVLRQIEAGEAYLGLVGRKSDSPDLEFRSFACDALALIVPRKHPLAKKKSVALDELLSLPLILRETGSGSRWCLEQGLAAVGKSVRDLHVVLELGSTEAIKQSVAQGLGLAILSTHSLSVGGDFRAIAIADVPLTREIYAVWDRRRALPLPARLFLDSLEPCAEAGHH